MAKNFEITMKRGDLGPPVFARVTNDIDGNAPDWSNATATFHMLAIDSTLGGTGEVTEVINAPAAIETPSASSGGLIYNWQPGDTDVVGRFMAFFTVRDSAIPESFPDEGYIWITIEETGA